MGDNLPSEKDSECANPLLSNGTASNGNYDSDSSSNGSGSSGNFGLHFSRIEYIHSPCTPPLVANANDSTDPMAENQGNEHNNRNTNGNIGINIDGDSDDVDVDGDGDGDDDGDGDEDGDDDCELVDDEDIDRDDNDDNDINVIIVVDTNYGTIENSDTNSTINANALPQQCLESGPPAKRQLLDNESSAASSSTAANVQALEKLEDRLGEIFCCAICLDLPKSAIYQCPMGHLMCAGCFNHILADGRLRNQIPTCPNCRVQLSKLTVTRNLAAEKAASELPVECQYCSVEFPLKFLYRHEKMECEMRKITCIYSILGCDWSGPYRNDHESKCIYPNKSGGEVMPTVEGFHCIVEKEKHIFKSMLQLLSSEKLIFVDIQLKPIRSRSSVQRLIYHSGHFMAFNLLWTIKGFINNNQSNPHESNERHITYQLILKSKISMKLSLNYFIVKGPFNELKVDLKLVTDEFSDARMEGAFHELPLCDSNECNRLLGEKSIYLRIFMNMVCKPITE